MARQTDTGAVRISVAVFTVILLTLLITGGIFGGDTFANQWRLEDRCDSASSIAAQVGMTADLQTLQDKVNAYTLSLKNMNGFSARVTLVNNDQQVRVLCSRTVKPKLSGLFQFKHGIHQTAHSTTDRVG